MLNPFDVSSDAELLFCGNILGPLSDYDISGRRDTVAYTSMRERLRHVWWSQAWRETAPNTCVHATLGVVVPLATDGVRVCVWDGSETWLVAKGNIMGPVLPHLQDISAWNWSTNQPRVSIQPEWLRDAWEEQHRIDAMLVSGAITPADAIEAESYIKWEKPKTKKQSTVALAMELLNSLST